MFYLSRNTYTRRTFRGLNLLKYQCWFNGERREHRQTHTVKKELQNPKDPKPLWSIWSVYIVYLCRPQCRVNPSKTHVKTDRQTHIGKEEPRILKPFDLFDLVNCPQGYIILKPFDLLTCWIVHEGLSIGELESRINTPRTNAPVLTVQSYM